MNDMNAMQIFYSVPGQAVITVVLMAILVMTIRFFIHRFHEVRVAEREIDHHLSLIDDARIEQNSQTRGKTRKLWPRMPKPAKSAMGAKQTITPY